MMVAMTAALGLTYLGVVLCYLASSKAEERLLGARLAARFPTRFRGAGGGVLAVAMALFAIAWPGAEGILVGMAALILAASVVVIAAPLVPRLIPVTVGLAFVAAALAQWGATY